MKYNVIVSVPVHENLDVVKDQIRNFKKYILGVGIVIHISEEFYRQIKGLKELETISDVFINDKHINTDEKGIIYAHISNYHCASAHCSFDYFIMHASNDMYVKEGITDYLYNYDAGFNIHKIFSYSQWWPGNYALQDKQLLYLLKKHEMDAIIGTQVESSFYKSDVFGYIVKIIEESVSYEDIQLKYPREEIYFSTIAYHVLKKDRIGYPTTFSEVHRFDRWLWRMRYLTWGIYHRLKIEKLISRQTYDKFERWYFNILLNSKCYRITPRIVKKVLALDKHFLLRNRYLSDGRSTYQLYGDNIFAVKRVKRDVNDTLRKYINSLEESNE